MKMKKSKKGLDIILFIGSIVFIFITIYSIIVNKDIYTIISNFLVILILFYSSFIVYKNNKEIKENEINKNKKN